MRTATLGLLNVSALRRRLAGLTALIAVAVGLCLSSFAITERASAASHQRLAEGVANRSVTLTQDSDRNDIKALTGPNLRSVSRMSGVSQVEPVTQASFGYKDAQVAGVLLYATTPRASLLPPIVRRVRPAVFPLKAGEVVLPTRGDGSDLSSLLGQHISVEVTQKIGPDTGVTEQRDVYVVGLFSPSWQVDGPNAAYADASTVIAWAALGNGVAPPKYLEEVGYDSATVVAQSSREVPGLLDRLQAAGFSAVSFQQQLEELPTILNLVHGIGEILMVVLVGLTTFCAYQVMAALGRQRRREIGILKAVGFSNGRVFWMLSIEAAFTAFCGAAIGLVLSSAIASVGNGLLRRHEDLRAYLLPGWVHPGFGAAGLALALALAVVLLGALAPAVRAARLDPADAMRSW